MTPEQAAAEYWELVDDVATAAPILARFERAGKVLKTHMAAKGLATFKGIKLESFSRGRRLDMSALTEKVGAEVVEDCKRESVGYRLLAWRRPKAAKAAKPAA